MLKIDLENEKLLVFKEDGKDDVSISFEPQIITSGDKIKIYGIAGSALVDKFVHYSKIEVSGVPHGSAKETHAAIKSLCSVFKKGGTGGVSPTIHNSLLSRSAEDCHPIGAITGFGDALTHLNDKIDNFKIPTEKYPIVRNMRFKRNDSNLTVEFDKPLILEVGQTAYLQYARLGKKSKHKAKQFRWIRIGERAQANDMQAKGMTEFYRILVPNNSKSIIIPKASLEKIYFPPQIRGQVDRSWLQWTAIRSGKQHNTTNTFNGVPHKYNRRDSKVFYKFRICVYDNTKGWLHGKESVRTLMIQEFVVTEHGNQTRLNRKYVIQ